MTHSPTYMTLNHRAAELSSSRISPSQTFFSNSSLLASSWVTLFLWLNKRYRQKTMPRRAIVVIQMDQPELTKSLIGTPYLTFLRSEERRVGNEYRTGRAAKK